MQCQTHWTQLDKHVSREHSAQRDPITYSQYPHTPCTSTNGWRDKVSCYYGSSYINLLKNRRTASDHWAFDCGTPIDRKQHQQQDTVLPIPGSSAILKLTIDPRIIIAVQKVRCRVGSMSSLIGSLGLEQGFGAYSSPSRWLASSAHHARHTPSTHPRSSTPLSSCLTLHASTSVK